MIVDSSVKEDMNIRYVHAYCVVLLCFTLFLMFYSLFTTSLSYLVLYTASHTMAAPCLLLVDLLSLLCKARSICWYFISCIFSLLNDLNS